MTVSPAMAQYIEKLIEDGEYADYDERERYTGDYSGNLIGSPNRKPTRGTGRGKGARGLGHHNKEESPW